MFDLHTHSTYSDGHNTPEEMVRAAIDLGLEKIGISDHSYTDFDEFWCMKKEKIEEYKNCIRELKEKYKDRIEVLLGVEQDYYTVEPTDDYDYVIGSVHYLKLGDEYVNIDQSTKLLYDAADKYFGGDLMSLIEMYYEKVGEIVDKTGADIIGHFDLIRKFNRDGSLFDEQSARYRAAAKKALDRLIPSGKKFEINTGAISRGYLDDVYPSSEWIEYIRERGGKFILSGDSHSVTTLCHSFHKYQHLVD
ncbi:MAG: histidinol-phosphatase HisJ family protein [Clostridia bacterium]|nr:histidinol-phosphatase HisJ family protein [Clostridia bacterium]